MLATAPRRNLDADPLAGRRALVLGADGLLGTAWRRLLTDGAFAGRATVDVRRPTWREPVDVIVNCAAFTDVDGAETREDEANAVNAYALEGLAAQARTTGALLVHFSTDYVFDGGARHPYRTTDPRSPINAYGRSKALGEEILERSGCRYLLVRTSWLYAPWGRNFVTTIDRLAQERPTLQVVDDQRGRPTSALHLARTTAALIRAGAEGTFHVTDGGSCTWYELARAVVALRGHRCSVEPTTSDAYARPARRPAWSVLDLTKTTALVGPMPHWTSGVSEVLAR